MSFSNPNYKTQGESSKNKQSNFTTNNISKKKRLSDIPLEESEEEDENNDDEWFSESSTSSNEGDDREPRLIMYAAYCQYDSVKEVAKTIFNYHLTKNEQKEFDIAWYDGPISLKLLQRMWPHQRTNHFPGMYNLARKNCLGRHLTRMQKWFPDDYDFFPQTFMLPIDYKEFKSQITAKRNKTFIVKPEAGCQGKGIFLTRNYEDIEQGEHYVIQRYMHKPYLVDGFKFDLRLYVMLYGVNPLRIYLFKEGLARFATIPYESPQPSNLQNLFMHLTNYAINKESANFIANTNAQDDDKGSKRSFTSILQRIKLEFGEDRVIDVVGDIKDLIIKTLCIAQPHLQHLYRSCQPDDLENQMCYQILGFDIMLDHKLKPQLLEVNQSPSFTTDSPLDYKIKKELITDTIRLLNLSIKRKLKTKGVKRAEMQKRLFKFNNDKKEETKQNSKRVEKNLSNNLGQGTQSVLVPKSKIKPTTMTQNQGVKEKQPEKLALTKIQKKEEKEEQRRKKMLQRDRQEKEICGNFSLIYPLVSYEEEFKILEEEKQLAQRSKSGSPKKQGIETEEEEDEKQTLDSLKEMSPWEQQQMYIKFMEKAKELWESFTNGTQVQRKFRQKEEELKLKEEEREKKVKMQKQKLLERMRRQQEERKVQIEQRMNSFRRVQNGLDEEGNLLSSNQQQEIYSQQKRKSSAGPLSTREKNNDNNEFSNQSKFVSPLHQRPPQYFYDNRQLQNEFFLPFVEHKRQLNNHPQQVMTQNPKRQALEQYERKYAYLAKYYNENNLQAIPAVPALQSSKIHSQSTQPPDLPKSPDSKRQRQSLQKNDSWNQIQKPPLNKSQLVQLKRDESDQNNSFMKQRMILQQQNQHQWQVQSQVKTGEVKVMSQESSPGIKPENTVANKAFGPFAADQYSRRGKAKNSIGPNNQSNQSEMKIGGLSNYNIQGSGNINRELQRKSASQGRREHKINKLQKNSVSQNSDKMQQLPIQINYQNPIVLTLNTKQIQIKKREGGQDQQSNPDILNLGVVGERKQLQGIDYKSLEQQSKIPIKKQHRILKIKDRSMKLDSQEFIQNLSNALQHSSSYKNNVIAKQLTKS